MISWLFEIDTLRLSTKDVTWSATEYSGLIIADSFSGITMRWNIAGNGLIAPNEMTFDVSNPGGTSSIGDFEGEFCTVRLIEDDSNTRTWKFKIERAISYYGKITCYCVDFLQEHLVGDYPNTKAPKEIWPSSDAEDTDDYCVPVILGTAYIPVRSVNTATERYYILGEDITPLEYTVDEVMSPHAWPNSSTWTPPTYDMDTSVASGYQLLQPKIDERVTPPATGLWPSGDSFYDMLCKYSRADTVTITNPADCTEYVLEDFGVASADIDATTFSAAATTYGTVSFDGCAWWRKEPRERVLSNLLAQTDSFLKCTDKVELHQFSATPVETITDALLLSFSPSKVTKSKNDSGRVHWPESATKPSDILTGTTVVPTHGGVGATENTPSSEILECKFLAGDSVSAQKAGILYFQKKFEQSQRVNFSVTFSTLFAKATLTPGQVVTVNNSLYGGSNNVIITDMTINPDMRVDFTGVVLNYLEDWGDLAPAAITVVEDTSEGFPSAEDGTNTATILLYQRDTAPPVVTDIADPVTYTFADRTIAGSIGTWSREVPSGTDPLYIISVMVSAKTATVTIARSEWSTPVVLAQNGADGTPGVDAGNWSLQSTFTFSSTDYDTVAWVGGELYTGPDTYTITGGNTGNITALTYIYFNPTASTTTLLTTTTGSNAVGSGRILVGVAKNNTDVTSDAIFQIFGGTGGMLFTADNIAAGTITGDKIAANTIDSAQINTGAITIGSWSGAGALAEQSAVTWASQVTGTGKPADYANYTTNTNQLTDGSNLGGTATWSGVSSKPTFGSLASLSTITSTYISDGAVTTAKIYAGAITAAKIAAGTITANEINVSNLFSENITMSGRVLIYNTGLSGYGNELRFANSSSGPYIYANETSRLSLSASSTITMSLSSTNLISVDSTMGVNIKGANDIAFNTNDLYIDTSASRVGIGTTAPTYTLDVVGNIGMDSTLYHNDDTDTWIGFGSDRITLEVGGVTMIDFQETSLGEYIFIETDYIYLQTSSAVKMQLDPKNIQFFPTTDNTGDVGLSTKRWNEIRGNSIYKGSGTLLDDFDDLYELSKLKALTRKTIDEQTKEVLSEETVMNEKANAPTMDSMSLPRFITNYDEIVLQLKKDNGDLISDTEIDAMINDYDEAGWMLSIDVGLYGDLATGAIRQLDSEVISMFELLSSRITTLENQLRTQK